MARKQVFGVRLEERQLNNLNELLNEVNEEYGTKLTLADLIRESIDNAVPILRKTKASWIMYYL